MFSSVAKVNSVGRTLVLHAELHYGTSYYKIAREAGPKFVP